MNERSQGGDSSTSRASPKKLWETQITPITLPLDRSPKATKMRPFDLVKKWGFYGFSHDIDTLMDFHPFKEFAAHFLPLGQAIALRLMGQNLVHFFQALL